MAAVVLLFACSTMPAAEDPTVARVEPASGINSEVVPVRIEGAGFHLPIVDDLDTGELAVGVVNVRIGDTPLGDVAWRGEMLIEGAVPAGLVPGTYDVTVSIGERSTVVRDGYTVIADCVPQWMGTPALGAATPVTGANSDMDEADPFVTEDDLTLYLVRGADVWRSERASPLDPFGTAVLDALSSSASDTKLSTTADGLLAYVATQRIPSTGGTDVWRGVRTSKAEAFTFDRVGLDAVNTAEHQWDPHISADGLRLYVAPDSGVMQHVAVATRTSITEPFGAATVIPELVAGFDNDPTVSRDQRVIVYATDRDGQRKLWYAVRPSVTAPFDAPRVLAGGGIGDDAPHISPDGCSLYFVSGRSGNRDIYVAPVR